MIVGQNYPQEPPQIKFISKINMAGVNQSNGSIDNKYFDVLKNWNRKYIISRLED